MVAFHSSQQPITCTVSCTTEPSGISFKERPREPLALAALLLVPGGSEISFRTLSTQMPRYVGKVRTSRGTKFTARDTDTWPVPVAEIATGPGFAGRDEKFVIFCWREVAPGRNEVCRGKKSECFQLWMT